MVAARFSLKSKLQDHDSKEMADDVDKAKEICAMCQQE